MKLATLDDLLAEIGLGNAMSVVVAKKICNMGTPPFHRQPKVTDICPLKGADGVLITFCEMLPPYSWRPDYRPRQPR